MNFAADRVGFCNYVDELCIAVSLQSVDQIKSNWISKSVADQRGIAKKKIVN